MYPLCLLLNALMIVKKYLSNLLLNRNDLAVDKLVLNRLVLNRLIVNRLVLNGLVLNRLVL